jgi:transposase
LREDRGMNFGMGDYNGTPLGAGGTRRMEPNEKTEEWYRDQQEQDRQEREDNLQDIIRLLRDENKELKEEVSTLKLIIQGITRYFN